ncbi:MAG: hypothetical protein EOP07_24980, partial [Proteobacteria bacterium]
MKLSSLSFMTILLFAPACSKSFEKCLAQASPGTTGDPCSAAGGPGSDAGPDASSIKVVPWICEGKAQPQCYQGSTSSFTKVYPKMDKSTCEVLDVIKDRIVSMDKCTIPAPDLVVIQSFLPSGLEILGSQKGSLESGKAIYRVTYRNGFDVISQIFDSNGKSLPLNTLMNPDEWISETLRSDLKDAALNIKEKRFLGVLKANLSSKEKKAKQAEIAGLLAPYISAADLETIKGIEPVSFNQFEFKTQYQSLRKIIPQLKPHLSLLDEAPIACVEGYPVFCRKQADGSYKFDDPIRIETDECPIYQA